MKTNNREFIDLKYIFLIGFFIMAMSIFFDLQKEFLMILLGIVMIIVYIKSESLLKGIYKEIRSTIQYAQGEEEIQIKDGDLGLLYDEMRNLKRRSHAYESTIEAEKVKLRQTIEDICHQLKTPLTSISIYTELLLEKENGNKYFIEIDQQIEKMKYLIQSLLKLAKLEAHQVDFDLESLPVNQVMQLSLQSLHSMFEQTQKHLHMETSEVTCYCDESWLQEAFSNIIKNSLEQDCQNISISFQEHKQYIKVFIYNDGEEINNQDLPHIFERFYRSTKQQGVGIGLALAKEIVERHHGDITVYNQSGVIFEITLPRFEMNQKYQLS